MNCIIFKIQSSYVKYSSLVQCTFKKCLNLTPKGVFFSSSFSGCVHRDKSKCLIALPTAAEYVRVFEKILIGGFSCVNTRLAFDSQILQPKDNIDDSKLKFDLKISNVNQKKNNYKVPKYGQK